MGVTVNHSGALAEDADSPDPSGRGRQTRYDRVPGPLARSPRHAGQELLARDGPVRFDRAAIRGPGRPRARYRDDDGDRAHRPRLFFVAGANLFHLGLTLLAALGAAVGLIMTIGSVPLQRVQTFMDPWSDPNGAGLQTIKGWRLSAPAGCSDRPGQRARLCANDFNDFIFSHVAQELGMVGARGHRAVRGSAWAGVRTALRAPDTFGGLMAAGSPPGSPSRPSSTSAWWSTWCRHRDHLAVRFGGGSSLIVSFAAIGILLSISRETAEGGAWNAPADRGRGYGRTYLPGSRGRSITASDSDLA